LELFMNQIVVPAAFQLRGDAPRATVERSGCRPLWERILREQPDYLE